MIGWNRRRERSMMKGLNRARAKALMNPEDREKIQSWVDLNTDLQIEEDKLKAEAWLALDKKRQSVQRMHDKLAKIIEDDIWKGDIY